MIQNVLIQKDQEPKGAVMMQSDLIQKIREPKEDFIKKMMISNQIDQLEDQIVLMDLKNLLTERRK